MGHRYPLLGRSIEVANVAALARIGRAVPILIYLVVAVSPVPMTWRR